MAMMGVDDQAVDAGRLPVAWSVACGAIAVAASYSVGNLPMIVIALGVTAIDLAVRAPWPAILGQRQSQYSSRQIRRAVIKKL